MSPFQVRPPPSIGQGRANPEAPSWAMGDLGHLSVAWMVTPVLGSAACSEAKAPEKSRKRLT